VTCAFCERIAHGELVSENDLAVAIIDAYPVTPGHCLIVPRRHEPDFLALTFAENAAIWALMTLVRAQIEQSATPDGYNLGVNVGESAGQTIGHAHLHVIPRRRGDVADPRGGIRWVIPARAAYWEER
jgi:diadenosine tetraphosphate (Ap4A) HIT family hydrolase